MPPPGWHIRALSRIRSFTITHNYEALSLGPSMPDGTRFLFVTSDDNASATQVPRILVLAIRGL